MVKMVVMVKMVTMVKMVAIMMAKIVVRAKMVSIAKTVETDIFYTFLNYCSGVAESTFRVSATKAVSLI